MNYQGEYSIKTKLNSNIKIGEALILVKKFPEFCLYRGYCCSVFESHEEKLYEIEFYSRFKKVDLSLKELKTHPNYNFLTTSDTHLVSGDDFVCLETQNLLYRTYFKRFFLKNNFF